MKRPPRLPRDWLHVDKATASSRVIYSYALENEKSNYEMDRMTYPKTNLQSVSYPEQSKSFKTQKSRHKLQGPPPPGSLSMFMKLSFADKWLLEA